MNPLFVEFFPAPFPGFVSPPVLGLPPTPRCWWPPPVLRSQRRYVKFYGVKFFKEFRLELTVSTMIEASCFFPGFRLVWTVFDDFFFPGGGFEHALAKCKNGNMQGRDGV